MLYAKNVDAQILERPHIENLCYIMSYSIYNIKYPNLTSILCIQEKINSFVRMVLLSEVIMVIIT